jgi:hypothetical protein
MERQKAVRAGPPSQRRRARQLTKGASLSGTPVSVRRDGPWSPEVAVLLACARPRLGPDAAARLETAVGRVVDWARLLELARAHGLSPLLHHHAAAGALPMPSPSLSVLRAQAAANVRRALRFAAALVEVIDVCGSADISLAPLKGPILAQQLYGSVALRQTKDLDLLVRHADVPRLVRLLEARGYRLTNRETPELDAFAVRDLHHVSVTHPRRRVHIEIHYWLLRPRGRRSHGFDDIAARLRPIPFFGRQVQVLDDEALLVYLCEHGAEHTWSRLEWLVGVNDLRRRTDAAHAAASSFAHELGATTRVRAAMDLAATLLEAGGEPGGSSAGPSFAANRFVIRRLQREPGRVAGTSAERFFYGWRTDASLTAVLRRCRTMLLAPSIGDRRAMPLPRWLRPLLWVFRPFRLSARQLGQRRTR